MPPLAGRAMHGEASPNSFSSPLPLAYHTPALCASVQCKSFPAFGPLLFLISVPDQHHPSQTTFLNHLLSLTLIHFLHRLSYSSVT